MDIRGLIEKLDKDLNHLLKVCYERKSKPGLEDIILQDLKKFEEDAVRLKLLLKSIKCKELNKQISDFQIQLEKGIKLFACDKGAGIDSLRREMVFLRRLLQRLRRELELNWREPLRVKILGIGEITTTIELEGPGAPLRRKPDGKNWVRLAIKKAPSFPDKASAEKYISLCYEYENFLSRSLGITTPYAEHKLIPGQRDRWLVYNFQERLPSYTIACVIIRVAREEVIERIFLRLLNEMQKIFLWNINHPEYEVGFDGQIPNWAFIRFSSEHPEIEEDEPVYYLDTTTPLIRREGKEQLDVEIFLKSIPLFLRSIVRRTLLKEVLDRYYRPRDVILDLIASLITHHKPELVPKMVKMTNEWLKQNLSQLQILPYTVKEIISYNRQDVLIWKFFRQMKRLDRFITEKIFRKTYEQRLPHGSPVNWQNLVGAGGKGLTLPEELKTLMESNKSKEAFS